MESLVRALGSFLLAVPAAAYSALRRPAPAGHVHSGLMTSSAWEGWWHEDLADG